MGTAPTLQPTDSRCFGATGRRPIDGRALRRHHHRDGCGRRDPGAHAGPVGQADPAAGAGRLPPREKENWEPEAVFVKGRYTSPDSWTDKGGDPFQPGVHYYVGGATKLYGAALYRLRPADFGELKHVDGISPAWPLTYEDFEPWYTKAEWLYQVHGCHGEDPTEGAWSRQYPWPSVSHEPRIQQIHDDLEKAGYHPFNAPCGILLDEANPPHSTCIRCTWCDGYPCLVQAKADAETIAVLPALAAPERHPAGQDRGDPPPDRPERTLRHRRRHPARRQPRRP